MVKVRAETGIKNHIALWEIMPLSHCQNPCVKATTLLDGYRCQEHTGKKDTQGGETRVFAASSPTGIRTALDAHSDDAAQMIHETPHPAVA